MYEIETAHIPDFPDGEFYISKFPITVKDWNNVLSYIPEDHREQLWIDNIVDSSVVDIAYKNNITWTQAVLWTYIYSELVGTTYRLMSVDQWKWLTKDDPIAGNYYGERWINQKLIQNKYGVADLLDVCDHWTRTPIKPEDNGLTMAVVGLRSKDTIRYGRASYTNNRLGFRIVSLTTNPKKILTFLGVIRE